MGAQSGKEMQHDVAGGGVDRSEGGGTCQEQRKKRTRREDGDTGAEREMGAER